MSKFITTFTIALLLLVGTTSWSQDCNCTITEVENNMVTPCDLIIGSIDTVSTTQELKNAIITANNSGNRTVLIADGTYPIASGSWYPYITGSNIVFRSLSGNRDNVILTGTGMKSVSPLVENGFYIVGNNVTIADLTIMEVGNHGIAGQGDSIFVHNVKIQNTFEQMIKGTSAGDGADYGRVQCSLFEYPAGVGPQYYIGGLDIHQGNNWVVNDNIFRNIASPSGSIAEHAIHFWNSSADNIIERNIIYNCDRGIGFGLGNSPSYRGIIRNNMIYNDGSGTFNDVGIGLESCPDTKVYNNTIYVNYPNAIEYRFESTIDVKITNNLTNKRIQSRNGGQAILNTNYTEAMSSWFVDLSQGNLRLNEERSEIVDQGTNLSEVIVDLDQTSRPQAARTDIGAHEWLQATGINDVVNNGSNVILSPNPADNFIELQSDLKTKYDVRIYNSMNQLITVYNSLNLESAVSINVSEWKSGIYFCQVLALDQRPELLRLVISK